MNAYICNKCDQVVSDKKTMETMTKVTLSADCIGKYDELHLCDACKCEFLKFVKNKENK